ncbi:MAG TPA: hypothetical protein DD706_24635 [Nitrospiraceae bacterium]|nr:hypothetical protein [Nitrospiraceae bacterium]
MKYLNKDVRAFTTIGSGLLPALTNQIKVSEAFTPTQTSELLKKKSDYIAIWDTGATNTVITKKVASDLGLKPSGIAEVTGVHGRCQVHTYLINVYLPNGVAFSAVKVSEGEFVGGDVLIGMDIIRSGDFAITNFDKKTVFTFRVPSLEQMDFVKEINQSNSKYKKVTMSPEDLRRNRNKAKQGRRGKKGR